MKKILKKLMVSSMLLSLYSMPIKATNISETNNQYQIVENDGEEYIIDEEGAKYSNFQTASGEVLTAEEALIILNTSAIENTDNSIQPRYQIAPDLEPGSFSVTSYNLNYVGEERKVSPDSIGPCEIEYGESTSITDSYSFSASATIKNIMINKIDAQLGFDWTHSVNTTVHFQVIYQVNKGKTGAVFFKPYYGKFNASYVHTDQRLYKGTLMSPKKTAAGLADGLYYLKEWNTK